MASGDLDRRRSVLTAALGFALLDPRDPELRLLHGWLDSWRGIGDIVTGGGVEQDPADRMNNEATLARVVESVQAVVNRLPWEGRPREWYF